MRPISLRRGLLVAVAVLSLTPCAADAMSLAGQETESCAAYGAKHPGSATDRAEGDHIAERFKAAGLDTSIESFHLPVWQPGAVTLSSAGGTSYPAESFAYGGTGTVTAPVVDGGTFNGANLVTADVKGKLVIVSLGLEHRTAYVDTLIKLGAAGMIAVTGAPDDLVGTGSARWAYRPPATIPALTVSSSVGQAIRDDMKNGPLTLTATVAGQRVDAIGRDIIGVRRGTTYPDRYIVMGAHYDSWYSGAVDNCSAIGTMLQTIADTAGEAPAYTIIFAAWDAEETGLVGSYSWLIRHPELLASTVFNENLEMTGGLPLVSGVDVVNPVTAAGTENPVVQTLLSTAAVSSGYAPVLLPVVAYRNLVGGLIATDLEGFVAAGVQGMSTVTGTDYYHTTGDTFRTINLSVLDGQTTFAEAVLRDAQDIAPTAFTAVQQVPHVEIQAPATAAAAGAAVPMTVKVTDVTGLPVRGASVRMLASQHDNWALTEQYATEVGDGVYRWTLPPGITDADRTLLRATVNQAGYIATGYGAIDQRGDAVLPAGSSCRSRRVLTLHVRVPERAGTIRSLRATTTQGKVRVVAGHRLRLDLRAVKRGTVTVRVTVRTSRGRTLRQQRVYHTCLRGP